MKPSVSHTILVTGANGQLGHELRELSVRYPAYNFLFTGRSELPIENTNVVRQFFGSNDIKFCINCAAYTAVDKAEEESDLAMLINGTAVGELASVCQASGVKLIHISTDYVYDGTRKEPLKEDHEVAPLNTYGRTKLAGDHLALEKNPESVIIRTSWVYSSYGHNFLKTMMRLLVEKKEINVVADQIGSPTYAANLAEVIMTFADAVSAGKNFSGIYNYANYGITSWFQFAQLIKDRVGSNCIIHPVTSSQYPTAATRPLYSVLDTEKIKNDLGINIPFWKKSVDQCIEKILGSS